MLIERLETELKEALKAKDMIKISCIRMLKADMHNLSIQKKGDLSEEDIIKVIQKQVKQHKESIEQFEKGKRDDLVRKERQEQDMLESFLPNMLPEEDLKKIINDVISELGSPAKKEMGKVIKEVIARAQGRADGKTVSQIVSGLLK